MLIAITFPVDEVFNLALTSALDKSVFKHLFNCPFRTVIKKLRRWGCLCTPITSVWLDERDMEHIVNLMHAVWKVQTVRSAAKASQDFERSDPSRYQLASTSGSQV